MPAPWRATLEARYADAENAYETCVEKMLSDDDAEVGALSKQLKDANRLVDKAVTKSGQHE